MSPADITNVKSSSACSRGGREKEPEICGVQGDESCEKVGPEQVLAVGETDLELKEVVREISNECWRMA